LDGAVKKKVNYLLTGYYGFQNAGDDSFCMVGSWGIHRFWGGGAFKFLSAEIPTILVPGSAVFNNRNKKIPGYSSIYTPIKTILAELSTDRVIFMGGSVFSKKSSKFDRKLMSHLAANGRITLSAIGVSIGPFKTDADYDWVQNFLQGFSYIAVRDTPSYKIACDMGLSEKTVKAFDLAVLLPLLNQEFHLKENRIPPEKTKKTVLGVSVCHYERYLPNGDLELERQREQKILETVALLAKNEEIKIKLFIFNGNPRKGDVELTGEFYRHLKGIKGSEIEIIPYNANPLKVWEEIQACDAFFGVRLHSAIFAYTAEIPFILVEYHRKCTDFLTEIGYQDTFRIPAEMKEPEEAADLIRQLINAKNCHSLPVKDAQDLALLNFYQSPWFTGNS
jgi:polysaccharide pyruvyl transferase WcaK-like protein